MSDPEDADTDDRLGHARDGTLPRGETIVRDENPRPTRRQRCALEGAANSVAKVACRRMSEPGQLQVARNNAHGKRALTLLARNGQRGCRDAKCDDQLDARIVAV